VDPASRSCVVEPWYCEQPVVSENKSEVGVLVGNLGADERTGPNAPALSGIPWIEWATADRRCRVDGFGIASQSENCRLPLEAFGASLVCRLSSRSDSAHGRSRPGFRALFFPSGEELSILCR